MTTLLDETNQPFAAGSLDPEGIALTSSGTVFISSEGDAEQLIKPFIKEFSLTSSDNSRPSWCRVVWMPPVSAASVTI